MMEQDLDIDRLTGGKYFISETSYIERYSALNRIDDHQLDDVQ